MEEKDLQVENGKYTRIVNSVIDELVKAPLLGAELAICLFVIRKTYGYSKTEDEISLSQFEEGVGRSRPTIVKALKNLQLVNILQLVKVGCSKTSSSVWKFNKYHAKWKLVNTPQLVKYNAPTSKEKLLQLVKTPKHTKDNTKETKEIGKRTKKQQKEKFSVLGADVIKAFEEVDPKNKTYYQNTTQREACDFLIETYGLEQVLKVIKILPKTNIKEHFPNITTPFELKEKWVKLRDAFPRKQQELQKTKGRGLA